MATLNKLFAMYLGVVWLRVQGFIVDQRDLTTNIFWREYDSPGASWALTQVSLHERAWTSNSREAKAKAAKDCPWRSSK